MSEKFWIDDINVLLKVGNIIPTVGMSNSEKLNSLTRLLIIISTVLFFMDYDQWCSVLLIGLLLIIILRSTVLSSQSEGFSPHRGGPVSGCGSINGVPCSTCGQDTQQAKINAKYEVTPLLQFNSDNDSKRSYMNAKYEVTPLDVPAPFREIWRNEPEFTGEFTMVPNPYTISPGTDLTEIPHSQAHYISRSSVDHLPISQTSGGLVSARPAVESAWFTASTEHRNSIMGEHIDRFARERQHGCTDIKVGRKTF